MNLKKSISLMLASAAISTAFSATTLIATASMISEIHKPHEHELFGHRPHQHGPFGHRPPQHELFRHRPHEHRSFGHKPHRNGPLGHKASKISKGDM